MSKNKIVLDRISISGNIVKYPFSTNTELDRFFNSKELFIQYDTDVADVPVSILAIPFVNILSGFSWLVDATIKVD